MTATGTDSRQAAATESRSAADEGALADCDVLVVAHSYQTFTKHQIDRLAERCDSVTVLVRYNRFADISEYVHVDYLRPHRRKAKIDRTNQPANVTVVPLPLLYLPIEYHYRRLGTKHYEAAVDVIEERGVEFDLIHAHFTWTAGYVGARLAEDHDVPCVLTVHENEQWLANLAENDNEDVDYTWENVDAIVRVNEKDVPLLEQFNDNVHSIPNGYPREEFPLVDPDEARASLGVDPETNLVFGLGALNERKRWGDLLQALAELDADRRDITCAIAGRGARKETLRSRVRELGLEGTVDVLGYVPQDELARWMNAADIFVLASEAEGNPTVMFEALSCGTPYVGTDVGGVSEIIESETYGLTCPPRSPERLAATIEEGLSREWDREAIVEYASQFTWDAIVDQLVDVLLEALDRQPVPSDA